MCNGVIADRLVPRGNTAACFSLSHTLGAEVNLDLAFITQKEYLRSGTCVRGILKWYLSGPLKALEPGFARPQGLQRAIYVPLEYPTNSGTLSEVPFFAL